MEEYSALTFLTLVKSTNGSNVTLKGKHSTDLKSDNHEQKGKIEVKFVGGGWIRRQRRTAFQICKQPW